MNPSEKIPQERRGPLLEATREFAHRLDELYGLYLDASTGFKANVAGIKERQEARVQQGASLAELDQLRFFYGRGDPNKPTSYVQHQTTQGQYKARNDVGGANYRLLSQTFIVFVFHLWDNEYRQNFAQLLGMKEAEELSLPILGDFRLLRNDILKHRGVLTEDKSRRLEVIDNLVVGQGITFSADDIEQLVRTIKASLDNMVLSATGIDPEFRKVWRLQ